MPDCLLFNLVRMTVQLAAELVEFFQHPASGVALKAASSVWERRHRSLTRVATQGTIELSCRRGDVGGYLCAVTRSGARSSDNGPVPPGGA
jgi:hypothetical protein